MAALAAAGLVLANACQAPPEYFRRDLTPDERAAVADDLLGGMVQRYYQGTPEEQLTLREALTLAPDLAALHREAGIAYVKRGLKSEWPHGYGRAVELDPLNWQGWRGYLHLYFHRDYRRAIADFDALDALTPGQTDYPQATSIDFMRGAAYMQLGEYQTALDYLDRFLEEEVSAPGQEVYLGAAVWVYRAVCLGGLGRGAEAEASLRRGLEVQGGESAELWYYLAERVHAGGRTAEACEMLAEALLQAERGYTLSRPYVEDFYEVDAATVRRRQGAWCEEGS